ncbi:MAG: acyltransferase [Candidatus Aminicenantales bacterium]
MGVEIGTGSYISGGARIDVRRGQISIGDRVNISHGTYILSHAGFQDLKPGQKTVIEDDVKIFVNSVILPGVRIGRNSTVGASSVVTKDVPPNVVVMGNPARVIRHLENGAKSPEVKAPDNP